LAALLLGWSLLLAQPVQAQSVGSAFTYQGELRTGGNPATGSFDMEYRLYDSLAGSSQVGPVVTRNAVAVANGLFSVPLDFGPAQFAGERQWLEVRIRPAGGGAFETLTPRTEMTAAPYALGAVAALANSVTTTSIVDGAVGAADLNVAQVQRRVTGFCPPGQYVRAVLQDGTVTCGSDAGGAGTVTSVGTGAGLSGGPITSSGSIAVATGGISSAMIADGNVTSADILDTQVQRRVVGSCATGQYVRVVNQDGTVVCGTDAGGSGATGTVTTVNTGPGLTGGPITAVGTVAIATGGVTSTLIADGTIASVDIAPGAVDSAAIANGSVLATDIDASQVQRRVGGSCALGNFVRSVNQDGTVVCSTDSQGSGTVTSVGAGSGLTGGPITTSGTIGIATSGVITPMIAPGAVGSLQLAAAAVETSKIADGSVTVAKVNPSQVQARVTGNCVTGQYVRAVNQDGSVLCGTDSGTGTVTTVVTGTGLTGGPITTSGTISIAPGGIGSTEINAAQVQRRITGTCTGGNFVQQVNQDGTVACTPAPSANAWSLSGNAATNPATQFLGTTDAQPLVIRTRNVRSVAIEASTALDVSGNPLTANVVMGSFANLIAPGVRGAAIGGGGIPSGTSDPDFGAGDRNIVHDHYGSIGGGWDNLAGNSVTGITAEPFATVGGGRGNAALAANASVAGGFGNIASGVGTAIGGGEGNLAIGLTSAVGGGIDNTSSGGSSTVPGGTGNTASGTSSAVGGGSANCAGGNFSWAGGRRAKVRPGLPGNSAGSGCSGVPDSADADGDDGSFVWADGQNSDFTSSGANQFLVRATGGMVVSGGAVNDPAGNRLRVSGGTVRIDQLGTAGSQSLCRNADNQIATCSSSARYKTDITDLELGLETAQQLRPVGFRWKTDGSADIGFVAEEVAALDERLATRDNGGTIEGVRYDRMTAVLVNAVQELAARESLAREAYERLAAEHAALAVEQRRLAAELAAMRAGGNLRKGAR
jgi:hypothetical protein